MRKMKIFCDGWLVCIADLSQEEIDTFQKDLSLVLIPVE